MPVRCPVLVTLSNAETVRDEDIVLQVPDGRSITTLVNSWLRLKLEDAAACPAYIYTERQAGYRTAKPSDL